MRPAAPICLALVAVVLAIQGSLGQNCANRLDIVFVLDGSQSLRKTNWEKVKSSVVDFITQSQTRAPNARFGVVVYSSGVRADGILEITEGNKILNRVRNLAYPELGTDTHLGINEATNMFARNAVNGVPQVMIVITDGRSRLPDETAKSASQARSEGINMFAAGVFTQFSSTAKRMFIEELTAIASNDQQYVQLDDFSTLASTVLGFLTTVCTSTVTKVDGGWSGWARSSIGSCQSDCRRSVTLTRTCTNPAPFGGGLQCSGASTDSITESCTGDSCLRVNGGWSGWARSTIGLCQSDCMRSVTLTRTCTNPAPSGGGLQCSGATTDNIRESCTGNSCLRVNGGWTAWARSSIGLCQSDCMRSVTLTRTCTNPAPSGGGLQCSGATTDNIRESCTGDSCLRANGGWSAWLRSSIGLCQSDCKRSVTLTRTCTNPAPSGGGLQCSGATTDNIRESCTGDSCFRANGGWSAWIRSSIGLCQSDCRRSVTLTRTCTNPAPSGGGLQCSGASTDSITESCTGNSCLRVNGGWSAWLRSTIGLCQSDCKRSVTLTRSCTNPAPSGGGLQCSGAFTDNIRESCTGDSCLRVNGGWTAWGRTTIGFCSSDCKRSVTLTRTCTNPAPSGGGLQCSGATTDTLTEACSGGSCVKADGGWSAWIRSTIGLCQSDCKRSVTLTRTCTNPAPSGGGLQCSGATTDNIRESCTGDSCLIVNGAWSEWTTSSKTKCFSTCKRTVNRERTCTNPAPKNGGSQCIGSNTGSIEESCSGDDCVTAVDGGWTAWARITVGRCSKTCKRTVSRTRTCTNPKPSTGGQQCSGSGSDSIIEACTGEDCVTSDCPFDVLFVVDESEVMRSIPYTKNGKVAFTRVNDQIIAYLEAVIKEKEPGVAKAGYITLGFEYKGRAATRVVMSMNSDLRSLVTAINGIVRQDISLRWDQVIKTLPALVPRGSKVIIITASGVKTNERVATASAMANIDATFFAIGLPFKTGTPLSTESLAPIASSSENIRIVTAFDDTSIKNELETIIPIVCPKSGSAVCSNIMDVVVVVDGSFSILEDTFNNVLKNTLLGLTDQLFGLGRDLKMGMILYSHQVDANIALTSSKTSFKFSISALVYPDGGTWTYVGIEAGRKLFAKSSRSDATKLMIVITDGQSNDPSQTVREAALAKNAGITIYAVGVGTGATSELRNMASSPNHVLTAADYSQLLTQLKELTSQCAVDGAWADWKLLRYGDCSVTCASGTRERYETRTCTNPEPKNGGEDCGTENKRNFAESCNTNVLCPVWGAWSQYTEIAKCSVTCGANGIRVMQRSRTCINDINSGMGCGQKSPQKESKNEACSSPISCAYWATWSAYIYGDCSATCGTGKTQIGTRTRTCVNDDTTKRLCGKLSPDSEQTTRTCTQLPQCPSWGPWSSYVDITSCSVTCGTGTKKTESRRECQNDNTQKNGCGATSPQIATKDVNCFKASCPYWGPWSSFQYGSCSATCGSATQPGSRSRSCVNDDSSRLLCGKLSPDTEQTTRTCTSSPACPIWGAWSNYVDITQCSVTCGTGTKTTQRQRVCNNDVKTKDGCGVKSPQMENKQEQCYGSVCPYWSSWSSYNYASCSATCGTGATQTGTRSRTCLNDDSSKRRCGKLSPDIQQNTRTCTLSACPVWGAWTSYSDISGCSETCGQNGVKTIQRSRVCNNDASGIGCGAQSPQRESKPLKCILAACPSWGAWSQYSYEKCSATCGVATKKGTRSRTCINDDSSKVLCGKPSPDTEQKTQICTNTPACPFWGKWSNYVDRTTCSVTCGTGIKTVQRQRECQNDITGGGGCGKTSPDVETKQAQCFRSACPSWGVWSSYAYGKCSATCGTGATQVGIRSRPCLNDDSSKRLCGKLSPDQEQQTRACTLRDCPSWGSWSGYSAITACSVTCGANGVWTVRSTRVCRNDITDGTGCGKKSPDTKTKQAVCSSPTTCPYWSTWSGFSYSSCTATCGTGITKTATRSRTCLNDVENGNGCGSRSPQTDQQTQQCTVSACPFWGSWTTYTAITSCSKTCGTGGVITVQRTRVCNNDQASHTACGSLSPDKESKLQACSSSTKCPVWSTWTDYSYGQCSKTCGTGGTQSGSRSRTCINDNKSKTACGSSSPQVQNNVKECVLNPCPYWAFWSRYEPTEACSVTCGAGGTWMTRRTRQCINDNTKHNGCGATSPQMETKRSACSSPVTCPYWSSWSGYKYGTCSSTCGKGVTRNGQRSRICLNDLSQNKNGCGRTSPDIQNQAKACAVPLCPTWGVWSSFEAKTPCSVTCGTGGTWKLQRTQKCDNDIPSAMGCGSKSPKIETKTESCQTNTPCPAWSNWAPYTFSDCSATCGTGITKIATRSRTCSNDNTGFGCGAKSPDMQRIRQSCADSVCPSWSKWSTYVPVEKCSATCGVNGIWKTERSRVCTNDRGIANACGTSSPQRDSKFQSCPPNPVACPYWDAWSPYSYTGCSKTCGTGTKTGTRRRSCVNDISTKDGCGAKSPQTQYITETCTGAACPAWGSWSSYKPTGTCSVTCGTGGTWRTERTRVCNIDNTKHDACGSTSPQIERKTDSCISPVSCPYWGAWSGFRYERCSATCGTGITRMGTRSRICRNDVASKDGCGSASPQTERTPQPCRVPLCPSWATWTGYSAITPCSVTCGGSGTWTVQRKQVCNNDIPSAMGCGSKSPKTETKTESCVTQSKCPTWGAWTRYTYGNCDPPCGSNSIRTGQRTRTCNNDIASKLGCGARSPQTETDVQSCTVAACASWGRWSQYTLTQCSVTCGPGGTLTKRRTRTCSTDNARHDACGKTSPELETKTQSCTSPNTCPYWGSWSGFTYGSCTATCGSGITRIGQRLRYCLGDSKDVNACGAKSPQMDQQPKPCRVPACPAWGAWTGYTVISKCSTTCGTKGIVTTQRQRTCINDIPKGNGCGSTSPDQETSRQACSNQPACPQWGGWTAYTYDSCSATCGRNIITSGTRSRTCDNDTPNKLGCGSKSPEFQKAFKDCALSPCPSWAPWSQFSAISACSATCGTGTWTTRRSRQCVNDNDKHNGCGQTSPQIETKSESCTSPKTCPYWSSWSGFKYGDCSATCGSKISRIGVRSRFCRNDVSGKDCGDSSPQTDRQPQLCSVPSCPTWAVWSSYTPIQPCSVTCGTNGVWTVRRQRQCINDIPARTGCGDNSPQQESRKDSCRTNVLCPSWSTWTTYIPVTPCSVTCRGQNGVQTLRRSRSCLNDVTGGGGCGSGVSQESITQSCSSNVGCPVDGQWGPWKKGAVSACSVTCGKGTQTRTLNRACDSPSALNNGRDCVALKGIGATMTESEECTMVACPRAPISLCDSVKMVNGVGYRLHPTDCDKFVQCYFRSKDGYAIGVIHTCPFDYFWDQSQLRCSPACNVDCPLDKCKGDCLSTHNMEGSCRAYWACNNGKSEAMCCPSGFAYVYNRGCQVDFTCRDKCPTICANKDVCSRRPVWEDTHKYESSMGKVGWFSSGCLRSNLYFDIIGCECSTAATQICTPDFIMDFSNPSATSNSGISISVSNVGISNGVASFSKSSRIRTQLALTEASASKPVAIVFQYKEAAMVKSRQILITSPQCKMAKSASMVFALEMDTFVVELTNWYGSRTRMEIVTDGLPVSSWKKVQFLYDGKFMTTTLEAGKRKYAERAYAPQVGLAQCGLDIGILETSSGFVGQMDTVGVYRCDPSIPVY